MIASNRSLGILSLSHIHFLDDTVAKNIYIHHKVCIFCFVNCDTIPGKLLPVVRNLLHYVCLSVRLSVCFYVVRLSLFLYLYGSVSSSMLVCVCLFAFLTFYCHVCVFVSQGPLAVARPDRSQREFEATGAGIQDSLQGQITNGQWDVF